MWIDVVTSVVMLLVAIGLYGYASTLAPGLRTGVREFLGPQFFPRVIAVILGLQSVILMVQTIVRARRNRSGHLRRSSPSDSKAPAHAKVLLSLVLLLGYVAAIRLAGYYVSTVIYVFASLMLLSQPDTRRRNVAGYLVLSVSSTVVIHVVFERLLWVFPPRGILF